MMSLPSSSSSIFRKKYDVFLSFRGEDTRKNFTDHLYDALKRSGIVTFRDDSKLEASKEIASTLFKAIQQSWCSVIIFSKTYAFSGWCLEELAEIVKQKKEQGLKVFPIFYDVDPSDLRRQRDKVEEAFAKHEERYKEDNHKIQKWRNALTEVADIKGWHLNDKHESEFIGDIVKKISAKLCQTYPIVHDELVGITSRLEKLYSKIEIGDDDVRIIGICGMGGIGKTTLARVVYNQMSPHFEGKSFIADVREVSDKCGLVSLQQQLLSQILFDEGFNFFNVHEGNAIISRRLSHKKVLVVLDDVDNLQHLKCLVGRRDWFGSGSRIIVTTRDEHLLLSHRVDDVYKPATLNDVDALQLFYSKAFDSDTISNNDFTELSKHVVGYAGGLPLALEVLGSFLCGRDAAQWRSAIERLKRDSNKEILDRLQISFDGLEEREKNIFLDIACFFNGEERDLVTKVLDGCEFFADIGMDVLVKKSLVTVDGYNRLWMHDLLKEMGRKIVREKSINEPGKRCRLWDERDVHHVLTKNTATEAIEGMIIDNKRGSNRMLKLSVDAFSKMKNMRLLKVLCLSECDHLNYLSNELRLLDWNGCPLRSLPASFQPHNLVALLLPYSRIEQLWKGNTPMYKLKLINLEGSQNLIKTPDFTMAPNLESLILEGCTRLVDIHPSIGNLDGLVLLNLKGCRNLTGLPSSIGGCKSLKTLNLSGCYKIENLPENLQQAQLLEELDLSETAITKPPSFIFRFKNLRVLDFRGRKGPSSKLRQNLASLFFGRTISMALMLPSLSGLSSLTKLNLRDCNLGEGDIPTDICCLSSLERLDLGGNNFISIPSSFTRFSKLKYLGLMNCKELKSLPELLTIIGGVNINGCASLELIANPSKVCDSQELIANPSKVRNSMDWTGFIGVNCYRLAENMNASTLLKKLLKNSRKTFDILLPGNEIPEWFSYQRVESSSINISLPLKIQNDSQWMGVALCCIFVNNDASRDENLYCEAFIRNTNSGEAGCEDDGDRREVESSCYLFCKEYNQPIIKDHLLLRYWSRDKLYPHSLQEKYSEREFDKLSTPNCSNQVWDELELSFEPDWLANSVKVKQCGVQMVYQKDLEDNQLIEEQQYNNQCSAEFEDNNEDGSIANGSLVKRNNLDWNELELSLVPIGPYGPYQLVKLKQSGIRMVYHKDSEDFNEDVSIANGSLVKPKRNIYEDTVEESQPKRMEKILNFMMVRPDKKPE